MYSSPQHYRCVACVVALSALAAQGQPVDVRPLIAEIKAVPRYNQWSLIDPSDRPPLKTALEISTQQRNDLIQRGNGVERGIALFVAEQQGDIDFLLSLADLLEDNEQTVPYALPVALGYAYGDQTVGEYLSAIYREWVGLDVGQSTKRFEEKIGEVPDVRYLVRPWIVRLRRSRQDPEIMREVKEQIGALPETVLWAVVTLGHKNSTYTREEAHAALTGLSQTTREMLESAGEDILPDEPLLRANAGSYRKVVLEEYAQLLLPSPARKEVDHHE